MVVFNDLKRPKGFFYFTVIAHSPGNPRRIHFHRAKDIVCLGEVPAEYAQLGAGSYIENSKGDGMYAEEALEEITERLAAAEKEDL